MSSQCWAGLKTARTVSSPRRTTRTWALLPMTAMSPSFAGIRWPCANAVDAARTIQSAAIDQDFICGPIIQSAAEASVARIALLGTGLLGSGMVMHFLKAGTPVTVWNRTEAKARALEADGATVAATPEAAAAVADHVHAVLPDAMLVDDTLEQIAPALNKGAIVIDHSTTRPEATGQRFEGARTKGSR